jgi:hypothetical protein
MGGDMSEQIEISQTNLIIYAHLVQYQNMGFKHSNKTELAQPKG